MFHVYFGITSFIRTKLSPADRTYTNSPSEFVEVLQRYAVTRSFDPRAAG
jgi:hypothetical protein